MKKNKAEGAHVDMACGCFSRACRHARRKRNIKTEEGQDETQKLALKKYSENNITTRKKAVVAHGRATRKLRYTKPRRQINRKRTRKKSSGRAAVARFSCGDRKRKS